MNGFTIKEKSQNAKLVGNPELRKAEGLSVNASYLSQETCPNDCPFLGSGCYAESGNTAFTTRRINKIAKAWVAIFGKAATIRRIINAYVKRIDALDPVRDFRHAVVGDCPDRRSASKVGRAMVRYQKRAMRLYGAVVSAWAFAHGWRTILEKYWYGANVIASCETTADIRLARSRGYATAIVVDRFKSDRAYQLDGHTIVPCPAQTQHVPCVKCRLCLDVSRLKRAEITIGFATHGSGAGLADQALMDSIRAWKIGQGMEWDREKRK